MSEEPSTGELGRTLADFREANRDDHARLRASVRHKVDRDLYDADQRLRSQELRELRGDLDDLRAEFQKYQETLDSRRKWLIACIILPLGSLIVASVLSIIEIIVGSTH